MKMLSRFASAFTLAALLAAGASSLTSCSDDSVLSQNETLKIPIETIPALYQLECADVADLGTVNASGTFAVKTFVRKRGEKNAVEHHEATARFKSGTNHLVLEGTSILYLPSEGYECRIIAMYPAHADVTLSPAGDTQYSGCIMAGESEWTTSANLHELYLHFRPVTE